MATKTPSYEAEARGGGQTAPLQATDKVFEVRVELPSGTFNDYLYDAAERALRLSAVVRPSWELPADCGAFTNTLAADGRPLPALVLVSRPFLPGCLLDVRVIGGVEEPSGAVGVVGVPAVDPAFAGLADVGDLSDEDREALARLARELVDEGAERRERQRWLLADEAAEVVREAQRAARIAVAANLAVGGSPAWQVLDPVLRKLRRTDEGDAHSEAEYSVMDLPPRFQRHVASCLLPEERLLHFVYRPEMTLDARLSLLRPRKLSDGLLVVTDRQVLWMTDALPPDSTLVDWGYLARSVPVERLRGARLIESGTQLRLEIEAEADGGVETLALEFPRASLDTCRSTATVLARFAPQLGCRALRRLYEATAVESDLALAEEMAGEDTARRLVAFAEASLAGEEIIAKASAPSSADRRHAAALMVLTKRRVVVVEDVRGGPALVGNRAYTAVSSVELRYSVLGSRLRLIVPANERREHIELDSESPGAFGPMLQAFRAMLPLLASPWRWAENAEVDLRPGV